jgi:hypothetical protein
MPVILCMKCEKHFYAKKREYKFCPHQECRASAKPHLRLIGYGKLEQSKVDEKLEFFREEKKDLQENPKVAKLCEYFGVDFKLIIDFIKSVAELKNFVYVAKDLKKAKREYALKKAWVTRHAEEIKAEAYDVGIELGRAKLLEEKKEWLSTRERTYNDNRNR